MIKRKKKIGKCVSTINVISSIFLIAALILPSISNPIVAHAESTTSTTSTTSTEAKIPYESALDSSAVTQEDLSDIEKKGLVIGNGELNAIVYTEGNDIRLRISKNDTWDMRIDTSKDANIPTVNPATGEVTGLNNDWNSWDNIYPTALPCVDIGLKAPSYQTAWNSSKLDLKKAIVTVASDADTTNISALAQSNVFYINSDREISFNGINEVVKDNGYSSISSWVNDVTTGITSEGYSYLCQTIPGDADVSGMSVYVVAGKSGSNQVVAVVTSRESAEPLVAAAALVTNTLNDANAIATHETTWKDFWSKSGIKLGDEELQRWWYHMVYYSRCFQKSGANAIGLKAGFDKLGGWHNSLKINYNTQQTYFSGAAVNHPELMEPLIDAVNNNLKRAEWFANTNFDGAEGAFFHSDFWPFEPDPASCATKNKHQLAYMPWGYTWGMQGHLATNLWEYYKYYPNQATLNKVYPAIKDFGLFYCSVLEKCKVDSNSKILIGPSYFPEAGNYGTYNNPYDIAFITYALNAAKEGATLKGDTALVNRINTILDKMPTYNTVADYDQENQTIVEDWNGAGLALDDRHGSKTQPIFPADQITYFSSQADKDLFTRTINREEKITTHANSNVMLNISRARLSLNDAISNAKMCFSSDSGYSPEQPNGLFYWNAHGYYISEQFAISRLVTEYLMQSVGDVIRIFPAWATDQDAHFTDLRARGGFLVSADLSSSVVSNVKITSTVGGNASLLNPWGSQNVVITEHESGAEVSCTASNNVITFPTKAGVSYDVATESSVSGAGGKATLIAPLGTMKMVIDPARTATWSVTDVDGNPTTLATIDSTTGILKAGANTGTIKVIANYFRRSSSAIIKIDNTELKTIDNTDSKITYTKGGSDVAWSTISDVNKSGGSETCNKTASEGPYSSDIKAEFTFTGTGVQWIGSLSSSAAKADVYIDGTKMATVDPYNSTTVDQNINYSIEGLTYGSHTIKIVNTGTKNPAGTGNTYDISIDAIRYIDSNIDSATLFSNNTIIEIGKTTTLSTSALLGQCDSYNIPNDTVTYTSSNPNVASVGNDGTVKGKSEGITDITGTVIKNGTEINTNTVTITVVSSENPIIIGAGGIAKYIGPSGTMKMVIIPEKNPTWSVTDEYGKDTTLATIDATTGILKAGDSPGTIKVVATYSDKTASTTIKIENIKLKTVDNTNSKITYTNGGSSTQWSTWDDDTRYGGSETYIKPGVSGSYSPDVKAEFTFTGTGVQWIGMLNRAEAQADVYIDGIKKASVDPYYDGTVTQHINYSIDGLPYRSHTIKIVNVGTKNLECTSNNYDLSIDAFRYISGSEEGTIINDNVKGNDVNQFDYSGSWSYYNSQSGAYKKDVHYTSDNNEYCQVKFNGNKVELYGTYSTDEGIAGISIDGGDETNIDLYASSRSDNALIYTSPLLSEGIHTIKVRATGNKNDASTSSFVTVDRLVVLQYSKDDVVIERPQLTSLTGGIKSLNIKYNAVDGATSYNIKYGKTTGNYTEVIKNVTDTSYTISDLEEGTEYYVVVSAVINGTESENSNELSKTTYSTDTNTIYYVNCGDETANVLENGEKFGILNSKEDQPYGVDSLTGNKWGYIADEDKTWSQDKQDESGIGYGCLRQYDGSTSGGGLTYKFEVPNGKYNINMGFYDPWSHTGRTEDILINGTIVVQNLCPTAIGKIAQNYTANVEDGILTVRAQESASADEKPLISWIKVVKEEVTHNVIYDANGGEGTAPKDDTVYSSNDVVKVKENTLTKAGYKFIGWNTSADGSGTNYYPTDLNNNTLIMGESNITLYAQWKDNTVKVTTPAAVELTRNDDTLIAKLKKEDGSEFTTNDVVTYDWFRNSELVNGENDNTYKLSNVDKGKSINVKVEQYGLVSKYIDIANDSTDEPIPSDKVKIPASVRIKGTETVGETLEAQLLDKDGVKVTTSSGVTYQWYRLSSKYSKDGTLIDDNKTYRLVANDKGNYIKLVAIYDGKTFEDITSMISMKSSSRNRRSRSSSRNRDTSENSNSSNNGLTTIIDGWKNEEGNTRIYIENGQPVTGWKQIAGYWYLMDMNGTMQTGWKQLNNKWYLLKDNGSMATGWQQVNNKWYLLKDNGDMATGWVQSNYKWYYLNQFGAMLINTSVNSYTLGTDGAWVE